MRECIYPEDSVFVTGVAKVTREDAINAMYGTFSLSLIIDGHTGMILNASANMVMQDTVEFLKDILIGRNLLTDGGSRYVDLKETVPGTVTKSRYYRFQGCPESFSAGVPTGEISTLLQILF